MVAFFVSFSKIFAESNFTKSENMITEVEIKKIIKTILGSKVVILKIEFKGLYTKNKLANIAINPAIVNFLFL